MPEAWFSANWVANIGRFIDSLKESIMRNIIPAMAFAAAVVCGFMTVQSANAAALYFEKVGVQTIDIS